MKPKFNIGDDVWLIEANRVIQMTVQGVYLHTEGTQNKWFRYFLDEKGIKGIPPYSYPENKVFASKEELIASL